jgi:[acyl-carrier-protein] S-malonyltransferase
MSWSALFPGQGSQHPGMGKFLYEEFTLAKRCFEEASDALSMNFKKLCFDGSESDLALTENTQPCLLLVSVATYRVLHEELGFTPIVAAGHSIGEYAAIVTAGSLSFADGMRSVRKRGQAMQSAVPVGTGGMTAVIGLEPEQVFELCKWAEKESGQSPVQPANINAPGQIVISGRKTLLDWIPGNVKPEMFAGARVKFIPLKVSAPFHCSMMKPAEEEMARVLGAVQFSEARFPIVQNVNAEAVTNGDTLRKNLITQISSPVRWIECVKNVRARGASKAIEVGCGKVISGLVKKIDSEGLRTFNINSLDDLKILSAEFKGA